MSSTRNDRDAGHRDEGDRGGDQARYRALVENLPAVIYQVAPDDDRPDDVRELARRDGARLSRAEWLEQPDIWMELLHPGRPRADARGARPAQRDRPALEPRVPAHRERRARRLVPRRREPRPRRRGRPLHWLGVQLDITELKEVEKELRKARDGLERRVAARTAELEEANELMTLEIGERRRAESELRAAEQRYRALAEQIPAVTYVWEVNRPEGAQSLEYTSPRIEQLLGYTAEEWQDPIDFWMSRLHPNDRHAVLAATMRSKIRGPFRSSTATSTRTGTSCGWRTTPSWWRPTSAADPTCSRG